MKEDRTLNSVVQQDLLEQRYFVIQFAQKDSNKLINSAPKSSQVFQLDMPSSCGGGWTGDLLVADTEELKNNTASEVHVK